MSRRNYVNEINFVTGNKHKLEEVKHILEPYGISVKRVTVDKLEIQSNDLCEIAEYSAKIVAERLRIPVVVEDAGLFIEALNGFPGPYSSYVFKTIGNEGILKLMRGVKNRRARFVSAVAYASPNGFVKVFIGVTEGLISIEPRGEYGFGFDPIFIPYEGDGRTFGEMTLDEKSRISHRGKAFRSLAKWLTGH
ncbi:MAG: non-canonical purine NTP pyrophosphatase, RdgB/HAM1 family [Thermoprotei archaeon]|nr:MAG: non-canonical purine NTP pyrophosphatase, RdgB/HAM1 family [Thermoprotei archaeon]